MSNRCAVDRCTTSLADNTLHTCIQLHSDCARASHDVTFNAQIDSLSLYLVNLYAMYGARICSISAATASHPPYMAGCHDSSPCRMHKVGCYTITDWHGTPKPQSVCPTCLLLPGRWSNLRPAGDRYPWLEPAGTPGALHIQCPTCGVTGLCPCCNTVEALATTAASGAAQAVACCTLQGTGC